MPPAAIPSRKLDPLTISIRKLILQSRPWWYGRPTPHLGVVTQHRGDVSPWAEIVWEFYLEES
jgi:hypothetical protein